MPADIESALQILVPPEFTSVGAERSDRWRAVRDDARRVLSRILATPDTMELAEEASELYARLPKRGHSRAYFACLCHEEIYAGKLVRGAILSLAWIEHSATSQFGRLSEAKFDRDQIWRWFRDAAPETLMTESD